MHGRQGPCPGKLIQEQSCLCVLDHPGQALFQIGARHGTAPQNVPAMGADLVEFQCLDHEISVSQSIEIGGQKARVILRYTPAESRRRPCIPGHQSCSQRPASWLPRVSKDIVSNFLCLELLNTCPPTTHLFLEQPVQLVPAVVDAQPVGRVDDPDERIGSFKVVPPVRPQSLLAAHVPYRVLAGDLLAA